MEVLTGFKRWLYQRYLNKQIAKHSDNHRIVNVEDANHIGVLHLGNTPNQIKIANDFQHFLQQEGKKVECLALIKKEDKENPYSSPHITNKQCNFYHFPKGEATARFMQTPFDILINLYTAEQLTLEYISTFAKANYRVGPFHKEKHHCYDLMIDLGETPKLEQYIKLIHHYLTHINKHVQAV